ncbi:hypothetical protein CkaCkLH20_06356 [Colletotrichum karsti]|uniref:Uncharacterized protein n=1 Tax=Colletotrichum karsti TaxID=1095194 RepID=A0A9P6I331_9PEZI|nr:uncharacterized protein CkaCkLH20_06356 [Colletotrichum karsti]KAF9876413.1 hypothetical protein CkaCkLH20_06356 [Colletotrichum karsti]
MSFTTLTDICCDADPDPCRGCHRIVHTHANPSTFLCARHDYRLRSKTAWAVSFGASTSASLIDSVRAGCDADEAELASATRALGAARARKARAEDAVAHSANVLVEARAQCAQVKHGVEAEYRRLYAAGAEYLGKWLLERGEIPREKAVEVEDRIGPMVELLERLDEVTGEVRRTGLMKGYPDLEQSYSCRIKDEHPPQETAAASEPPAERKRKRTKRTSDSRAHPYPPPEQRRRTTGEMAVRSESVKSEPMDETLAAIAPAPQHPTNTQQHISNRTESSNARPLSPLSAAMLGTTPQERAWKARILAERKATPLTGRTVQEIDKALDDWKKRCAGRVSFLTTKTWHDLRNERAILLGQL